MTATHYGWLLFAPVYVDMTTDDAPKVWARHASLEWLLAAAIWCQHSAIIYLSATRRGYVPAYAIRLTGMVER